VNLAVWYGQSDRRKAVCCPAGAKIYSSQIGCVTPKSFSPMGSVASSAEVQGPEHDDALSFSEEPKDVLFRECMSVSLPIRMHINGAYKAQRQLHFSLA